MIRGTADLPTLAEDAPTLSAYPEDTVLLNYVRCVQCTVEMRNSAREAVLLASLHPTIPAAMSIQVWQVGDSPWGAFSLAMVRIACRSGVGARGFVSAAFASTANATDALRASYSLPVLQATVELHRHYSGVDAQVRVNGRPILDFAGIDPEPMSDDDAQYTGSLTLAHTPNGLRLVQIEAEHHAHPVERLRPQLRLFSAADWGNPLLAPARAVSASIAGGAIELAPIRFVRRPDELAFTGTEAVKAAPA